MKKRKQTAARYEDGDVVGLRPVMKGMILVLCRLNRAVQFCKLKFGMRGLSVMCIIRWGIVGVIMGVILSACHGQHTLIH